ncbi:addiction module protein [Algoriphagus formosus]|uniref:addiction module protein n=1 Tax=Algoriphagus formosus TaxID=2007308 RepID=UPI000C29157B|nr:addiction module protein [Algoriphagus formosus]
MKAWKIRFLKKSFIKQSILLIPNYWKFLFSVVSEFNESNYELTSGQQAELKRRLDLFDAGKMKFGTWDEMISKIEKVKSLPQ